MGQTNGQCVSPSLHFGTAILVMIFGSMAIAQPVRLSPSDLPPNSLLGYSVALDGNRLVVGAPHHSAAYVFVGDDLQWNLLQKLEPPFPREVLGRYVAIRGNDLILSAEGTAYFYAFNGTSWELDQVVYQPYVYQVALDGDVAVLGSETLGTAQVYERISGTWTPTQTLNVGYVRTATVAIYGDLIAVGGQNLVKIFRHTGTSWVLESTIALPGLPNEDEFGISIALSDRFLMASAARAAGGRSVHIFEYQNGAWALLQELLPPDGSTTSSFGQGLDFRGDVAVAGAYVDNGAKGQAWLLRLCGDRWEFDRFIPPPDDIDNGFFGTAVSIDGPNAVISAPFEDTEGIQNSGAVYVFSTQTDCNQNTIVDGCEIAVHPQLDCDGDLVLDACGAFVDCNRNNILDLCDISNQVSEDCNHNAVPDECDIAAGEIDANADGIPDACFIPLCENSAGGTVFSLKAGAVNGRRIPPSNRVRIMPGDVLDSEIFISCWNHIGEFSLFEAAILVGDGATSGTIGTLLPLFWDAPFELDFCPCDDPQYPICDPITPRCVGPDHDPESSVFVDPLREDFILYGISGPAAVNVISLAYFRFGATAWDQVGTLDEGVGRYAATLRLIASQGSCGNFEIPFYQTPAYNYACNPSPIPNCEYPHFESLFVDVCTDDGLFCNGLEVCDPELGCQVLPPPNCDDGLACTVDACDEVADACSHVPNHAACTDSVACTIDTCDAALGCMHVPNDSACDDGDDCTRDTCTPVGCLHEPEDRCRDIPTTTHWGLLILTLGLLVASKIRFPNA